MKENVKKDFKDYLFIVDMNKGFCEQGNLSNPELKKAVPAICEFYKEHSDNLYTIAFTDCHTKDSPELDVFPSHCVNEDEIELIEELDVIVDAIIRKNSTNGFFALMDTFNNEQYSRYPNFSLTTAGLVSAENIYITGCLTSYCVLQFAITLKTFLNGCGHRNNVVIIENACADNDINDHNMGIEYAKRNGIKIIEYKGA